MPPGGVPQIYFYPKSYFFCDLKPHAKFRNPTKPPSGRKVTQAETEKNTVNSGHLVRLQRTQAARTKIKERMVERSGGCLEPNQG